MKLCHVLRNCIYCGFSVKGVYGHIQCFVFINSNYIKVYRTGCWINSTCDLDGSPGKGRFFPVYKPKANVTTSTWAEATGGGSRARTWQLTPLQLWKCHPGVQARHHKASSPGRFLRVLYGSSLPFLRGASDSVKPF